MTSGGVAMRGGLDDALSRMARRDELRRRAEGSAGSSGIEEVIRAVQRVVEKHPELSVMMAIDDPETTLWAQVKQSNGHAEVTVSPGDSPPPPPPTPAPPPHPLNGGAAAQPAATPQPPNRGSVPPGMPQPAPPPPRTNYTAARLAELLREDPSLLDPHDY